MLNIVAATIFASINLGSFAQGSVNDGVGTTGLRQQSELSLLSPVVHLNLSGLEADLRFEALRLPQIPTFDRLDGFAPVSDVDVGGTQKLISIDLSPSVDLGAAGSPRRGTVIIESLSGSVHLIATEAID